MLHIQQRYSYASVILHIASWRKSKKILKTKIFGGINWLRLSFLLPFKHYLYIAAFVCIICCILKLLSYYKETAGVIGHELLHVYGFGHTVMLNREVHYSNWFLAKIEQANITDFDV